MLRSVCWSSDVGQLVSRGFLPTSRTYSSTTVLWLSLKTTPILGEQFDSLYPTNLPGCNLTGMRIQLQNTLFRADSSGYLYFRLLRSGPLMWLSMTFTYRSTILFKCSPPAICTNGLLLFQYQQSVLFRYDNNAEQQFEFVAAKIAMPLYIRLVWGVAPAESTARFQADANTPLRYSWQSLSVR